MGAGSEIAALAWSTRLVRGARLAGRVGQAALVVKKFVEKGKA